MKIHKSLPFVVFLLSMVVFSCNSGEKDVRDDARSSLREIPPGSVPAPAAPPSAMTAGSTVPHYICPNNCQGSGGAAAGTCPVCGSEYQHNQAYHNQTAGNTPTINLGDQQNTTLPSITPEPAQNAAGVWHYTCPSGCTGGAGAAGKCATCGGDLAHNTAYHN